MKVKEYIESGILESYVLGAVTEAEAQQLLQLKKQHPEIERALQELEVDMERLAGYMAVTPPPDMWNRISDDIDKQIVLFDNAPKVKDFTGNGHSQNGNKYIEVEAESTHMRIHKSWKWVFAAVFVLGKIFLGFAIYFYLENRQAQEQIQQLKTEMQQLQHK
ncbi:hypothetical protein KXQ82_12540 [Mucilaginibacter sp. HMF5004]|uniref:hypothetical protein n=1 Tax=Mucilaginibacter rivuli TaxID=2857527 RepID=UPI001C5D4ABE|nr:hypothetical protein [Mucilaginibacter rivuli]MBW4890555.1 hypothetical protein [Mucilaginibacter rivuli]